MIGGDFDDLTQMPDHSVWPVWLKILGHAVWSPLPIPEKNNEPEPA